MPSAKSKPGIAARKSAASKAASMSSGSLDAMKLYRLSVMDRVEMVREGVPAEYVEELAASMAIPKEKLYRTIGVARPTVDRKIRERKRLSQHESERVMGIARLIGLAQSLVHTSGDAQDFDAARWLASWLYEPLNALGGKRPAELMDTSEGRSLIGALLSQQQSGAYA